VLDASGISIAPPKRLRSITTTTQAIPQQPTSSRVRRSDAKPMTTKKQEAKITATESDEGDKSDDDDDDENEDEDEENEDDDEENEDDNEDEENEDNDEENNDDDEENDDEDDDKGCHVTNANIKDDLGMIL
jgi:hypothetical protein